MNPPTPSHVLSPKSKNRLVQEQPERIIITLSGKTKGARVVIGVPMCTSTQIAHYERSPYLDPSRALRNWG